MNEPDRIWPHVVVVDAILVQGLAHALDDAAVDLALDDHRIDDGADVVHGDVVEQFDNPVSGSISTSAMCAPQGKVKFTGS